MKEEERFVTYLTLSDTWQEVASTVRAKFNAGKKDLRVHLVYQYGRAQNGEIPVEPAPAVATKAPATQTREGESWKGRLTGFWTQSGQDAHEGASMSW